MYIVKSSMKNNTLQYKCWYGTSSILKLQEALLSQHVHVI